MSRAKAQEVSYEEVRFMDTPALFTSLRIEKASIPDGLHRYEIREEDGDPCQLALGILVDHFGTLLTTDPIQLAVDGYLSFEPEALVFVMGGANTLEEFQQKHPATGRSVMKLYTARPEEAPLFFSWSDGRDVANGCIGHLCGDFEGNVFHNTWWPHHWDSQYNDNAFKEDFTRVIVWLRTGFSPMKDLKTMETFCSHSAEAALPNEYKTYGFRIETDRFRYMLRCVPVKGTYQVYLYCYSKEAAALAA